MWQECIPLCYVFVPIFEAIEVDVRSRKSMNKKSSKKGQKSEMPAGAARAVLVRGGQKLCLPALFARKLIWYAYLRVITFLFAILGQTFRKPRSKSCHIASRVVWQECIPLCYVFVPIYLKQ